MVYFSRGPMVMGKPGTRSDYALGGIAVQLAAQSHMAGDRRNPVHDPAHPTAYYSTATSTLSRADFQGRFAATDRARESRIGSHLAAARLPHAIDDTDGPTNSADQTRHMPTQV